MLHDPKEDVTQEPAADNTGNQTDDQVNQEQQGEGQE